MKVLRPLQEFRAGNILEFAFSLVRIAVVSVSWLLLPLYVSAQTSPITASGLNTQIGAPMNVAGGKVQYDITGGTRPGNGPNLFHSFGEFGVPTSNIANFLNDSGRATSNILGRVTGGNTSNIFGTIQTTGFGNANLFLMNPAGIMFGPNATLNVGGSVHFTTADYLRLNDGIRFNAVPGPQDALLSSAPVAAFGFLGSSPAAISVQGSLLSVPTGESISLVGGDITIQGGTLEDGTSQAAHLSAPGGQVRLASVGSPGEVLHSTLEFAPNINGQTFSNLGTVSVSENTTIDVSADAAGTVIIRGGQLVIANASISADTVQTNGAPVAVDINVTGDLSISTEANPAITARTTGSGDAGEIRLSSLNLTVASTLPELVTVIDSHTSGSGKAGDVAITTGNLLASGNLPGGGFDSLLVFIDAGTIASDGGRGGNIRLIANKIDLTNMSITTGDFIATNLGADATGSGGNLTIITDSLNVRSSFLDVSGFAAGNGGDLTISARDVQINTGSSLAASGFLKGGTIRINTDRIITDFSQFEVDTASEPAGGIFISAKIAEFRNGSTIGTQTFGDAAAGNIRVIATEHVTLSDDPTTDGTLARPSGFYTNSLGFGGTLGPAGSIVVTTPMLEITGGARLDSGTRTSGPAGPVTITADTVSISGERPFIIFESQFNEGGLASGIYSRTVGSRTGRRAACSGVCGDAGPISITAGTLNLGQGAEINSGTRSTGRGGDITIDANVISIAGTMSNGTPSGIFSNTTGTGSGAGAGGNIALQGDQVNLSNSATIIASSTGPGNAGNILIQASDSFISRNSTVNTSTTQSDGGNIAIIAGNLVHLIDSQITTDVQGGLGNGGNITIDPPTVLLDHSKIIASAIGGNGGNIRIVAGVFLASANSLIDASSTFGLSGTINIESPITNLSGTLAPLPQGFLQTAVFPGRCAARLQGGQASTLVVRTSRDRIPAEPGDLLLSPLFASTQGTAVARKFNDLGSLRAELTVPGGCPS